MKKAKIIYISYEDLKAVARYEKTFKDIFGDGVKNGRFKIRIEKKYQMSLEDLYEALRNAIKADPSMGDFSDYWLMPINYLYSFFGLQKACGEEEYDNFLDCDVDDNYVRGLKLREEEVFSDIWYEMVDVFTARYECDPGIDIKKQPAKEIAPFEDYLERIETFYINKSKSAEEINFPQPLKESFAASFEDNERRKTASALELKLARKFIDELCEAGNNRALHIKGYSYYGGNELYPCDWYASKECIEKLFDKTGDCIYANTLGYIYYYGRCNNGVGEYEKAFEMFSYGAANGVYESIYKLADMYCHGYACRKSPETAMNLYYYVYKECLNNFIDGCKDGEFADTAFRLGNAFLKGICDKPDYDCAYTFLLQADYASDIRLRASDFFGNITVSHNIKSALKEAKEALPEDYFEEYVSMAFPSVFSQMIEEGRRAEISVLNLGGGNAIVRLSASAKMCEDKPRPILVTYPEISFCSLMSEINFYATGAESDISSKGIKFDYCRWSSSFDEIEFYFDEKQVGYISCDMFYFAPDIGKDYDNTQVAMASVVFTPEGKTYDYICPLDDIKEGDTVIVPSYNGESEVEVVKLFTATIGDLPLPFERYKTIIEKAND